MVRTKFHEGRLDLKGDLGNDLVVFKDVNDWHLGQTAQQRDISWESRVKARDNSQESNEITSTRGGGEDATVIGPVNLVDPAARFGNLNTVRGAFLPVADVEKADGALSCHCDLTELRINLNRFNSDVSDGAAGLLGA